MLGEYGALLTSNGLVAFLVQLPSAIINFLHTSDGQLSAAVLVVVLLMLYLRKN